MNHVMIDLETMGDESNSVILSIGAVAFNIETGVTGMSFYETIDIQSCLDVGLKVNGGTIEWWLKKSKDAQEAYTKSTKRNLTDALVLLSSFLENRVNYGFKKENLSVWGKGPRFDMGILEDAYKAVGLKIPWSFRNEFCVRTMEFLDPKAITEVPDLGIIHNPVDDCLFQISYICKSYKKISEALHLMNGDKPNKYETGKNSRSEL